MIIDDLEHLKFISEKNNLESACILGSLDMTMIAPPSIILEPLVTASSFPSAVDLQFSGNVISSQYSLLEVFSNVFIRAFSPL